MEGATCRRLRTLAHWLRPGLPIFSKVLWVLDFYAVENTGNQSVASLAWQEPPGFLQSLPCKG